MATGWGRKVRLNQAKIACGVAADHTYTTTPFMALNTSNPNDDGQTAGEVTTTTSGYLRVTFSWTTPTLPSNDAAVIATNTALVTFGPSAGANAAWGTLTHISVWEKVSGTQEDISGGTAGGYLARATATVPQAVSAAGVSITVAASALVLNLISA